MNPKKLTLVALLTAMALIIFVVEARIPNPLPIPGVKLGLANIITVYAMFVLGPGPTLMILIVRVVLGSVFSGQMMALFYSLAGGLLCYLSMLVMRRLVTLKQVWVCSVVGAVFHNIGQIIVAILITRTPGIVVYLPVLLVSGILAGTFTGVCAQYVVHRLPRAWQSARTADEQTGPAR